jgi:stage V sporulation protein G
MNLDQIFTDIKVRPMDNMKNLKAFVDVVIAENFVCKGFKVMDGRNGLWVAMPSRLNTKSNEYEDIFHPITSEGRQMLFDLVLTKYEKVLEEQQNAPAPAENNNSGQENANSLQDDDTPPDEEIPF